jgi:hypothetical protein
MAFIPIPMNAARICDGLSKIGYTPGSAICDIIDNAATAKATHVYIKIIPEKNVSENRINNVKEYLIIDDGKGMEDAEIQSALALGSPSDNYEPYSLSKFGLGLKSASFSQGEILEVISSTGSANFLKYQVSLPEIRIRGVYGAEDVVLTLEDMSLIDEYLPDGHGTIIRITSIRKNNHPSIRSTLQDLRNKVGAIYYYIMQEETFQIFINGEECQPFDVLFTKEADANGNLDEHEWDGRTTKWIHKPSELTLEAEKNITAQIEATQLPHPPTFDLDGKGQQKAIRDKYHIDANNYGYYVYRNRRLLSWCESLNIIPRDIDFYSFRGRILIDDTADEVFNIDVKKSHIHLSDEAFEAIDYISSELKRKSKKAWEHAKNEIRRLTGENGLAVANTLAQQSEMPEELPGEAETEQEFKEVQRREEEVKSEQNKKVERLIKDEEEERPSIKELEEKEQVQVAVAGLDASPADKIFLVTNILDNALWEPYHDADKGTCVRINRFHRFTRVIHENNPNNGTLQTLVGLLLLQLAGAEIHLQRHLIKHSREEIADILENYRRVSSDYLTKMCRDLEDTLPSE